LTESVSENSTSSVGADVRRLKSLEKRLQDLEV
jgi:hypothetical protein